MSALLLVEPSQVIVQNTWGRIAVTTLDASGVPADPYSLTLNILDIYGNSLLTDTWTAITTPARLVHVTTGKFYIDFGNQTLNNETNGPYEWLFNWQVSLFSGGQQQNSMQKVKIVSPKMALIMTDLKLMIDKSRKLVNAANDCYLGYTEANLAMYLQGGLENINAYQPSLAFSMENYPMEYRQILIDSAMVVGVMSQELFAIDTDLQNYSDQGTSFTLAHQPQLAGYLNALTARLDKLIPQMKLQLIQSGTLHIQMGPNYRFNQIMQAGPSGAVYRGVVFTG